MSTQTGARGASRSRGRAQPRTDSEPRSDNERAANDQKRVAAKAAKSNFSIRGGATSKTSPVTKSGDGGTRNQAGQRTRATEQQQFSGSSHSRGGRAESSSRGATRSRVANTGEGGDRKPKGDGVQGHFVEYLSDLGTKKGRGSTMACTRGGHGSRGGSRTQSDRTLSTRSSSKSSSTIGSAGQAWRDPRRDGNANYMQSMADYFQTIKKKREQERRLAIRDGTMSDPDKPTTLANAITPVGTCQDMCPEFERVERIVQNMVDGCEKGENNAETAKVPYEERMIKRFRRSAAGYDEQLPSDIRPPLILKKTLDYLIEEVVGSPEDLGTIHKFVWDRTRGIRNDFSIQQVTKEEDILIAVECFERIARFHILSLHLLSRPGNDDFDHHQEREQLNNTLLSLMYYYDDNKKRMTFPNEAEFRSYCIVSEIQDQRPDLEDRMQNWGADLLKHPRIKNALKIYAAAGNAADEQGPLRPRAPFSVAQGNYGRFFDAVDSNSTSYLLACICEIYFNHVRSNALEVLVRAYRRFSSKSGAKASEDLILEDISEFLGFDNEDQTVNFCEEHGFTIGEAFNGVYYLDVSSVSPGLSDSNPRRKQIFSEDIVEFKRRNRSITAVINGLTFGQAAEKGLVSEAPSREVSMGGDEQDEYSAEEASGEEDDAQHKVQSASPTKATFQKPPTPMTSTPGNPFNQTSTVTPVSGTSVNHNPFDTAVLPANSTVTTLQQPLLAPQNPPTSSQIGKGQGKTDEKAANPFLLSSKITPQNNPFGLLPSTPATSKPFEISPVNPSSSNLLPFSAAMKQFEDPTPTPVFDFSAALKQANGKQTANGSNQTSQTTASGIPPIDTSRLGPPSKTFDFGFKKITQPTTPGSAQQSTQRSSISDQPLTPATTPGSTASTAGVTLGAAKAPAIDSVTPASTPSRPKTPPTTTFPAGLSQGQGLSNFNAPPAKLLFQPAIQIEQPPTPSNPHAIPDLFHSTSTAIPSTLVSSIDRQKEAREQLINQLAHELMDGSTNSYVDQFFEHVLGGIVKESLDIVQREEDDMLVEKHRTWYLSRRFGRKWRKITWDRYLFREHAARKRRLAEARKMAVKEAAVKEAEEREEREEQERVPVRKVTPGWMMLGTEKRRTQKGSSPTSQSTQQVVPSSDHPKRGSSKQKHSNRGSDPHHPTTSTSSHPTSSGKKRKSVDEESGEPGESDRLGRDHSPKRLRTMSNSSFNSVNSISNSRSLVGIDTTRSVYFKMIAMGMDPNTPIVPLTRRDVAEAQRTAAFAATQKRDGNIGGNTHLASQSAILNQSANHQSFDHALQPTEENTIAAVNYQQSIENSMGPPQTPMKYPATANGLPRASYSPEEQALFEQAAKIKAELDSGSEWYREELEKARRSTSSRSSPQPNQPNNILRQSRLHHYTSSKLRKGIISPTHSTHHTINGVQTVPAASDPKSPSYWRSRISKIYKPDDKADEAKRQKYGVLPKETAAQKRLREFSMNSPSRTQIRQAKNGGQDAWLKKSVYGQKQAAQAQGKGKGKGKAQDWGDMDYVDAEMSDEDDILEGNTQMTDALEEEGEEDGEDWDGMEDKNGVEYAPLGLNGFSAASSQNLGFAGGTGASADDAIEL